MAWRGVAWRGAAVRSVHPRPLALSNLDLGLDLGLDHGTVGRRGRGKLWRRLNRLPLLINRHELMVEGARGVIKVVRDGEGW